MYVCDHTEPLSNISWRQEIQANNKLRTKGVRWMHDERADRVLVGPDAGIGTARRTAKIRQNAAVLRGSRVQKDEQMYTIMMIPNVSIRQREERQWRQADGPGRR